MNAGGVPNTCKSNEKVPSGMSTVAHGCITRENLPFSEEYLREIGANTAYVPSGRKTASLLSLKDKLASYQLVGEVTAHQGFDG